jgi:hypothetical protein
LYTFSQITWKDILNYLKKKYDNDHSTLLENIYKPYIPSLDNATTLLHYHFGSYRITGVDDDEIQVVRWLLENSVKIAERCGGTVDGHRSLLTVCDSSDRTPLHILFQYGRKMSYSRYIPLLMEISDMVDELYRSDDYTCAQSCCCYWNEVILVQDGVWGCTNLHFMAENPFMDCNSVVSVMKKCIQSWECHRSGNCSSIENMVENQNGTNHHQQIDNSCHPLLFQIRDDAIPLSYLFLREKIDEPSSLQPWDTAEYLSLMDAFLGFVDCEYKVTYHGAFLVLISFLQSFCERVRDSLDELIQSNKWISTERMPFLLLQHFLCSKKCIQDVKVPNHVHGCLVTSFWEPMHILLEAAVKCNLHHLKDSRINNDSPAGHCFYQYAVSSHPVHLAASVANLPAFVLQLTLLLNLHDYPHVLLQQDEHGQIPLHYALLASPPSHVWHAGVHDGLVYWDSEHEPKSMVQYILDQEPNAANVLDVDGRLPIHLAILHHHMAGKEQSIEKTLCPIVYAAPIHIACIDPRTNLKPFMLAAVSNTAILDAIYFLLRLDPCVLYQLWNSHNITSSVVQS